MKGYMKVVMLTLACGSLGTVSTMVAMKHGATATLVMGGVLAVFFLWVGVLMGYGSFMTVLGSAAEASVFRIMREKAVGFAAEVALATGRNVGRRVLKEAFPMRVDDDFMKAAIVKMEQIAEQESKKAGQAVLESVEACYPQEPTGKT